MQPVSLPLNSLMLLQRIKPVEPISAQTFHHLFIVTFGDRHNLSSHSLDWFLNTKKARMVIDCITYCIFNARNLNWLMFNTKFQIHVSNHFITKIKFLLSGTNANRQLTSCMGRRLVPKNWNRRDMIDLSHIYVLYFFSFYLQHF